MKLSDEELKQKELKLRIQLNESGKVWREHKLIGWEEARDVADDLIRTGQAKKVEILMFDTDRGVDIHLGTTQRDMMGLGKNIIFKT